MRGGCLDNTETILLKQKLKIMLLRWGKNVIIMYTRKDNLIALLYSVKIKKKKFSQTVNFSPKSGENQQYTNKTQPTYIFCQHSWEMKAEKQKEHVDWSPSSFVYVCYGASSTYLIRS